MQITALYLRLSEHVAHNPPVADLLQLPFTLSAAQLTCNQ